MSRTDAQSYSPPAAARAAARKGLELRRKHGRGGTSVGVARARDLASGRDFPIETVKRMASFFARHAVDKQAKGSSSAGLWGDDDNPSAGYVAWLLWGGDPARKWAESVVARQDGGVSRYCEIRFDAAVPDALRAHLASPRQEPGGAWIVEGIAATEGVKSYPWGRELMPFDALKGRLDAFAGIRLTDEHPGVVSPDVRDDGTGVVLHAEAIEDARAIKVRLRLDSLPGKAGLSVGWHPVEIDPTPGEYEGERYDAVQRSMTPNHLALTNSPRNRGAGLRLDTMEAEMAQIVINGVVAEVDSAFAAEFSRAQDANKQRLDALEQERAGVVAERDELRGRVTALEASANDRLDSDEIKRLARERAALLAEALPLVPEAERVRLDSLDDDKIRGAVVAAAGIDVSGMSDAEVRGAYAVVKTRRNDGQTIANVIDNRSRQPRQDSTFGRTLGAKALKQDF
jgi:hypothetical protein